MANGVQGRQMQNYLVVQVPNPSPTHIHPAHQPLTSLFSHKYLGIYLTHNLSFNTYTYRQHTQYSQKKKPTKVLEEDSTQMYTEQQTHSLYHYSETNTGVLLWCLRPIH